MSKLESTGHTGKSTSALSRQMLSLRTGFPRQSLTQQYHWETKMNAPDSASMDDSPSDARFGRWVEVAFDCVPMRSVSRLDAPIDASPKYQQKFLRLKSAIEKHGTHNSYYLHNATCTYHLTNDPLLGMMQFDFEGVVLTCDKDLQVRSCDLEIDLTRETCSWLNQSIVDWLSETVQRNVMIEFERYIAAGDLSRTLERIEKQQAEMEADGGFVGMYL